MEYSAIYRCSLCGKTYKNHTKTGNRTAAVSCVLAMNGDTKMTPGVSMYEPHHCIDGGVGLAVFRGWKMEGTDG